MVFKLGTVEDMKILPQLEPSLRDYIKYLLLVLDTEYGTDRDIDSNDGGYVVFVTENTSDDEITEVFDFKNHSVEYVEIGETYSTAVYLLNNEYTVMLIMPTNELPDELKEFE